MADNAGDRTYLIEHTVGRGRNSHFKRVEGDTPAQAVDRFIDTTGGTNVQQVWQPVEWRQP